MTIWNLSAGLTMLLLAVSQSQAIPKTEAETASGRKLTLPDAFLGRTSILVVGFSKSSGKATEWWETRLTRDFGEPKKIPTMRVAHLEGIPAILRGLLLGKIKDNVPKEQRDSFLMLFQEEDAWKKVVSFDAPDDAYVVVVDPGGAVVWRTHAGIDDTAYAVAKGQLDTILAQHK